MSYLSGLECSECRTAHRAGEVHNLCDRCGAPLVVRYDLERVKQEWPRDALKDAPSTLWRYAPVLPVSDPRNIVSLGEGWTPLLRTSKLGFADVWVKDEGLNPTASFKARGQSVAISMCRELGVAAAAIPSAGNAAGAFAVYAAAGGIEAHVFMPRDVPQSNYVESKAAGARVTLVDGLISDCGRLVAEGAKAKAWFDLSTMKEPYRVEGKKTMGYEVAEQFEWRLPAAILYPAGGGVGLIGMWKAFDEMEALGWIGPARPKMSAVQTEGCAPVVRAFEQGREDVEFWQNAHTMVAGLRVPKPLGGKMMLGAIRASGGCAVAVTDREAIDGGLELAAAEGIFAAPEGGACVAALRKLFETGFLHPEERVVIYNTGSGLKYVEAYSVRYARTAESDTDKLGGLITPR